LKAAVNKDINVIKVEEISEPMPGSGQVKVKIAYCGVCGSDIEQLAGRFNPGRPRLGPMIMGHESTGTLVELGSNLVQGYKVGQRVAMNFITPCGVCYYCRNKMQHFCQHMTPNIGAFAEYCIYNEAAIYSIPDNMTFETAALLEPTSVAVHAVDQANIRPGSSVLISGAGPIGLLVLQVAIKAGATKVLVSEPIAEKRKIAVELGADVTVDPLKEDLEKIAANFTEGRLFDNIFEVSGNLKAAKQAITLAAKCGTVVWVAVYPADAEVSVNPFYMYRNELTIRSTFVSPYSFPRALDILPKLNLKPIITDIYSLNDIQKAFDNHHSTKTVKALIKP
jgi:2-desacetyl-2-hydroxyethyl bacteriochlorophyllide A dehydrogenase